MTGLCREAAAEMPSSGKPDKRALSCQATERKTKVWGPDTKSTFLAVERQPESP